MCEPTTILLIGSAVVGLIGQQAAADQQEAVNQNQYDKSVITRNQNAGQVELQRVQQAESAGQKINDNNTALREAQAAAVARAGPMGLSMDALLGDMARKGAGYNQSVNQNLDRVNMSLDNQLQNVNTNAVNEINSLKPPTQPDYLGTALKIGGAAYGAYNAPGAANTTDYRGAVLPNALRGGQ